MASGSKEIERCPKCGWLSVTKVVSDTPYISLIFQPTDNYFVCTNMKCDVERIYGENAILMRATNNEPTDRGN